MTFPKALFSFFVSLAAVLGPNAMAIPLGDPQRNPANGHYYHLLSPATWPESEAAAQALGGHLATINDDAENQWVVTTFRGLTGLQDAALWIGLNDALQEGTWAWANGDPLTYLNWAAGEPNNAVNSDPTGEDFASIRPAGNLPDGSWNDLPTDGGGDAYRIFGVVEVVPEPRPWLLIPVTTMVLWETCRRRRSRRTGC